MSLWDIDVSEEGYDADDFNIRSTERNMKIFLNKINEIIDHINKDGE